MSWRILLVGIIILFVLGLLAALAHPPMKTNITHVTVGTTTIAVGVANTPTARAQGLSGRASLPDSSGMLFVFDMPGNYGFWMKDMQFPLDIIFADASGRIVSVYQNLSPQTYLANPPQVFYPAAPALYVLEVPAGFAAAHGISVGMHFVLQ